MANIYIKKSVAHGNIKAIPSKSEAHRYIISILLSKSKNTITNIIYSKDIEATINCAVALGAKVTRKDDSIIIDATSFLNKNDILDCNESGSSLRFFIPLCLLDGKEYTLTGSKRLFERSLTEYENLCKEHGFLFELNENKLRLKGNLKVGNYKLSSDLSSQFTTGLLFALSYINGESNIEFVGNINSITYIDMTIAILNEFGINVSWLDDNHIRIIGNTFKPKDVIVSGDYSNTAFFEALNYLGGDVKIEGLNDKSLQADKVYIDYFKKLNDGYCTLDIAQCPDLFPILSVMAVLKHGAKFTSTSRLKIKESDRAMAMKDELSKFGADIVVNDDEVLVNKVELHSPTVDIEGHNDHRIVMAMAILLTQYGGTINGVEAVSKSYPNFFEDLESVL